MIAQNSRGKYDKANKNPSNTFNRRISLTVSPDLYDQMVDKSNRLGICTNYYIRNAIRNDLASDNCINALYELIIMETVDDAVEILSVNDLEQLKELANSTNDNYMRSKIRTIALKVVEKWI